jgi:hypothetical protein
VNKKQVKYYIVIVFANTVMSLAMKIREKAKEIRGFQQQDLKERKELKQF